MGFSKLLRSTEYISVQPKIQSPFFINTYLFLLSFAFYYHANSQYITRIPTRQAADLEQQQTFAEQAYF